MLCLRITGAYCVFSISKGDVQVLHCLKHAVDGNNDILEHQLGKGPPLFLTVAAAMYNSHLLDESALPALPCACRGTWKVLSVWHNALDFCVAT